MWKLVLVPLALLLVLLIAGAAWFTSTVSIFMTTSQSESKDLLSDLQICCPAQTVLVSRPWGKAGWMVFCDHEGTLHGPWVTAEAGKLVTRGQYSKGERSGLWEWYDHEGNVTKQVRYEAGVAGQTSEGPQ